MRFSPVSALKLHDAEGRSSSDHRLGPPCLLARWSGRPRPCHPDAGTARRPNQRNQIATRIVDAVAGLAASALISWMTSNPSNSGWVRVRERPEPAPAWAARNCSDRVQAVQSRREIPRLCGWRRGRDPHALDPATGERRQNPERCSDRLPVPTPSLERLLLFKADLKPFMAIYMKAPWRGRRTLPFLQPKTRTKGRSKALAGAVLPQS